MNQRSLCKYAYVNNENEYIMNLISEIFCWLNNALLQENRDQVVHPRMT